MSKGNRLKEKKKALNNKIKIGKVLFKLEVIVDENQNVTVNGPINDPLLIMQMLGGAMNVIVDHNFSTRKFNMDIEAGRKLKEAGRVMNEKEVPTENKIIKLN